MACHDTDVSWLALHRQLSFFTQHVSGFWSWHHVYIGKAKSATFIFAAI